MRSISGRSSRSTLMLTNRRFISSAVFSSSNDSCAITWHQWQAEYPIDSSIGLPLSRARTKASSLQGYQSTGFEACCSRYGLVSCASRLRCSFLSFMRLLPFRSEEHTSELQSRENIVCRLLLEKQNKHT